jgi:hypothetical protein
LDGINFSTLIRENHMKREDALIREKKIIDSLNEECLDMIKKLDLKKYQMPVID